MKTTDKSPEKICHNVFASETSGLACLGLVPIAWVCLNFAMTPRRHFETELLRRPLSTRGRLRMASRLLRLAITQPIRLRTIAGLHARWKSTSTPELICQVFDFDTGVPTFASKDFANLVTDGLYFMDSQSFDWIQHPTPNCYAFSEQVSARVFFLFFSSFFA